jgi:hypothetical protein
LVFHFNKAHLTNPEIPIWVVKHDGETEYVHHIEFENCSFSTKETPDNPHTKGSLKFKNVDLTTTEDGGTITDVITQRKNK